MEAEAGDAAEAARHRFFSARADRASRVLDNEETVERFAELSLPHGAPKLIDDDGGGGSIASRVLEGSAPGVPFRRVDVDEARLKPEREGDVGGTRPAQARDQNLGAGRELGCSKGKLEGGRPAAHGDGVFSSDELSERFFKSTHLFALDKHPTPQDLSDAGDRLLADERVDERNHARTYTKNRPRLG